MVFEISVDFIPVCYKINIQYVCLLSEQWDIVMRGETTRQDLTRMVSKLISRS